MSSDIASARRNFIAEFELIVPGLSISPAQIAPNFIILREPTQLPAGPATLVIRVEDEEIRRQIELPHGSDGSSTEVPIVRLR